MHAVPQPRRYYGVPVTASCEPGGPPAWGSPGRGHVWRVRLGISQGLPRYTLAPWHRRWALVPAVCLLYGCLTGDVPLLSSGEANFKYHKHESIVTPLPSPAPHARRPMQ